MAKITVLDSNNKVHGEYLLTSNEMVVGRDKSCGICLDSVGISRSHCLFFNKDGNYYVKNARDENETFHNGEKVVGEKRLSSGDLISVSAIFTLEIKFDPGETDAETFKVGRYAEEVARKNAKRAGRLKDLQADEVIQNKAKLKSILQKVDELNNAVSVIQKNSRTMIVLISCFCAALFGLAVTTLILLLRAR